MMLEAVAHTNYPDTQLLIAGEWRPSYGGLTRSVANPATGQTVGTVALADRSDLAEAVAAADRGFRIWSQTPACERAMKMRTAAGLVRERAEAIARLLTVEQGKPLVESTAEVFAAADIVEWFADEGRRAYGRVVPPRNPKSQQLVLKEPVGPVAAFTPWNFPVNQVVRKLSAALASGCSILIKGPEETPASPAALLQAFVDAGVPEGVIGLVFGEPAFISTYLISHPTIRKVTFTGSTAVGKELAALSGAHMKRVTMELGGHAPVVIARDADLQLAVRTMSAAKFRNAGQVCIAPTRFLVHNSVCEEFATAIARVAAEIQVGNGLDSDTTMGPLANTRRVSAMENLVADARRKRASVLAGGERIEGAGNFFMPTVLNDVALDAAVFNEEPFGPIVAIRGFDDIEEAICEANRLPFGLAAYAFTTTVGTVHRLMHGLEAGMVWVNQPPTPFAELPFGGVKESGYGSEGGPEALEAYLSTKTVSITVS